MDDQKLMKLLLLLQQVLIKVGVQRTDTGRKAGLTNMLVNAIRIIQDNEKNCTMRMLAREMLIAPPAATRIVNDLIEKKMVIREADPSDRRIVQLKITQRALEIFGQIHLEAAEMLHRVFEKVNQEEQDALILGLEAFVNAVVEIEREDASQQKVQEG